MKPPERRHGNRQMIVGPDCVSKRIEWEDSCDIFPAIEGMKPGLWLKTLSGYRTEALTRVDPFGCQNFKVLYSMNKKKRWNILKNVRDGIDELQDPSIKLRVSAAVQKIDRTFERMMYFDYKTKNMIGEYHDMSREGVETHNYSDGIMSRLHTIIRPNGRPKRPRGVRPYMDDLYDIPSTAEPNEIFQKVHIRYHITQLKGPRKTLYNRDGWPIFTRFWGWNEKATARKERLKCDLEEQKESYFAHCKCCHCDLAVQDAEYPFEEDEYMECDPLSIPSATAPISDFLTVKAPRLKKRKRMISRGDELIQKKKPSIIYRSTSTDSTDSFVSAFEFVDEEKEEIDGLVPVENMWGLDYDISSSGLLPVSPCTWIMHGWDQGVDDCFVLKFTGCKLKMFSAGTCHECDERIRWSRPDWTMDKPTHPGIVHSSSPKYRLPCEVCCSEFDQNNDPYALECGHIYCYNCWLIHFSSCIKAERVPVPCMNSTCSTTISPLAARALVRSATSNKYTQMLEVALRKQGKLMECPRCGWLNKATDAPSIDCVCGISLCSTCGGLSHFPIACDAYSHYAEFLDKSQLNDMDGFTTSTSEHIVEELALCPACHEYIERSQGCNHMSCRCGVQFCFICGKPWTTFAGGHYNCDKLNHKKVFLHDVIANHAPNLVPPSLVSIAIDCRRAFIAEMRDLKNRLKIICCVNLRGRVMKSVREMEILLEMCILHSRRSISARNAVSRARFALGYFLNTKDGRRERILLKVQFVESIAQQIRKTITR